MTETAPPQTDGGLDALLDHVKRTRGFDFTGYKRSSLERRIRRRMDAVGCATYLDYLDHLEVHPDEHAQLFDSILINVTAFFRDEGPWEHLAQDALPELLERRGADVPLRAWVAGCASGEEAYIVAMVLAEALGEPAYLERVKVYATDVDEHALAEARAATYTAKQVEAVPLALREKYFERVDQRLAFRKELRRNVIFGRNDLVQDAPISRIDLLLCRNTLMYLNAETQARVLGRFHFALQEDGILLLGKSEMLLTHGSLFRPIDLKHRLFTKVPCSAGRGARMSFGEPFEHLGDGASLGDAGFEAAPVAQVVVDGAGTVRSINRMARDRFSLGPPDLGRRLEDLELSYRPAELGPSIERVLAERLPLQLRGVTQRSAGGSERTYDVHLAPLASGDAALGVAISYVDTTAAHRLQQELERSRVDLEGAYEELQSTVEELETTNEELQSTNEELETTNEELQSTNEELETMNEELQSTNEELETINDELRQRTLELDHTNAFLETILTSMGVGVVVLDADQQVRVWNAHAEDLWGLRADEVAREHVLGLDIGLPVERLKGPIKAVLAGDEPRCELDVEATNRRGRSIVVRVSVLPLGQLGAPPSGLIVLMDEQP